MIDQPAHDTCPLCGGRTFDRLFVARDRLLDRPGTFPVVRCGNCGLTQLHPLPTAAELAAHYPPSYFPLDQDPADEARDVARGLLARVTAWLKRSGHASARILDVGCGTGLFLSLAAAQGMPTRGIELSEDAVDYARQRHGLNVHHGTLETAELEDAAFDIITMWHVLEHVPDPLDALRRCERALAPEGLLLIGVPNIESLEARLFGKRWYSLDAPRHLYHFTPATMTASLAKSGLDVERIVHSGGTAGFVYSVMGDITGVSLKLRSRPLHEGAYHRTARVLHLAVRPLCIGAAALSRGGAIEVYAVKRPRN